MSGLPAGWTVHESSSCPGKKYFFNASTGAKAWDLQEVLRSLSVSNFYRSGADPDGQALSQNAEASKPNVVSQIEKSKTSNQSDPGSEPDDNMTPEASFSSDDSLVFDEYELLERKRLKSKYKSPKQKKLKSSVQISESSVLTHQVEDLNDLPSQPLSPTTP